MPFRIAPPDDAAAIARAIVELSRDARMPQLASGRDSHRFSREAIAGRLAVLLNRCVGQGQGGADPEIFIDEEVRARAVETATAPQGMGI